jgi:hypothetical protein
MTEQESRLNLGDFRTALKRAALFTSSGGSGRPVLEAVRIKFGEDSIRFDAADGYKLAVQRMDATRTVGAGDADAMLTNADVATLLKALPKTVASDTDEIAITIGEFAGADPITIVHRWNDDEQVERVQRWDFIAYPATFPDMDRLIPRDQDTHGAQHIAIDAKHANAVNKAALVARGASGTVRWYFGDGDKSPAVALLGDSFVAVVMPLFVDWPNVSADATIGRVLGEPQYQDVETDAAS